MSEDHKEVALSGAYSAGKVVSFWAQPGAGENVEIDLVLAGPEVIDFRTLFVER